MRIAPEEPRTLMLSPLARNQNPPAHDGADHRVNIQSLSYGCAARKTTPQTQNCLFMGTASVSATPVPPEQAGADQEDRHARLRVVGRAGDITDSHWRQKPHVQH